MFFCILLHALRKHSGNFNPSPLGQWGCSVWSSAVRQLACPDLDTSSKWSTTGVKDQSLKHSESDSCNPVMCSGQGKDTAEVYLQVVSLFPRNLLLQATRRVCFSEPFPSVAHTLLLLEPERNDGSWENIPVPSGEGRETAADHHREWGMAGPTPGAALHFAETAGLGQGVERPLARFCKS